MAVYDLSGAWQCATELGIATVRLPGTLDENGIGRADRIAAPWHPDAKGNDALAAADAIATRLTRRHAYEGPATFTRRLEFAAPEGKRAFIEFERTRWLSLRVNGVEIPPLVPPTLSAPCAFEVTGRLTGRDTLEIVSDNRYPGWPREDILCSSAATDETQTNWNGVLGFMRLRLEEPVFIRSLRAYPRGDALDLCAEVSAPGPWQGTIIVNSDALGETASADARGDAGMTRVWLRGLPLRADVRRWDEGRGELYELEAALGESRNSVRFGVRYFSAQDGHLALNGRRIFLRGETNCATFPETGHPPMTTAQWQEILFLYRSYGANCVRFHSHCPPEAAFAAADELGMLMQPELSHWNPRKAFSSPESRRYYSLELERLLDALANHPSFVMLSLGNELVMDEDGHAFAARLLDRARALDPTRLYAEGSNNHYGQRGVETASDFYSSCCYYNHDLRATSSPMVGWLNRRYPDLSVDYSSAVAALRQRSGVPLFSFEVGQYEVLPDFDELEAFQGVTRPDNLRLIRDRVAAAGLLDRWRTCVRATGELALLCYRAEVEAALRTEGMSGISLLSLQDFPGQGTALVGMLNSHLKPKPYNFARPERFAAFFTGTLPLALLPRFTYTSGETLRCPLRMANYGAVELRGAPEWTLTGPGFALSGALDEVCAPCGRLAELGTVDIPLSDINVPARLSFAISLCGHENVYPIWVYPDEPLARPECVHECRSLDAAALNALAAGGAVYLAPDSTEEALPHSIRGQFCTDFWSVGTFPEQPGGMGQLIDAAHPLFEGFPTDEHTDWQWWPMAGQRAAILPDALRGIRPIVALLDSYAYLRRMAQIFECRCGGGRLLFSSLGLHKLAQYPEARALQRAIYGYMASERFAPQTEVPVEAVMAL